ncbi:MAG: protein phosphatase 2C domain-containing protein [Aureispira sp.]|nr:protein phosphatase 2C domain-containing protein [Aureispira sp.]
MKLYKTIKIGSSHPTFCEDFCLLQKIDTDWTIAAVMDGCTNAQDSHFASTLMAKVLKRVVQTLPYLAVSSVDLHDITTKELGIEIAQQFFKQFKQLKSILLLDKYELVSTLSFAVLHGTRKEAFVTVVGDGLIAVNGDIHSFEQNNQPNYLAYHLDKSFEAWFYNETEHFLFENVQDLALATDGIITFNGQKEPDFDPAQYLLINTDFAEIEQMLHKKCVLLEQEHGLLPIDDLAIVRVILD